MTAAIIGLVGATFGAVIALVGSALSDRRQARLEDVRWRRDQRVAAYEGALRSLLRARLHMFPKRLDQETDEWRRLWSESLNAWHEDLVDADFWVHTLSSRCDEVEAARLSDVVSGLTTAFNAYVEGIYEKEGIRRRALDDALQAAATTVAESFRRYLARTNASPNP